MTSRKSSRLIAMAAVAALSVPAVLAQPAAAEGDYGGYRYRAFLAVEIPEDATKKAPAESTRQTARAGTADAGTAPRAARPRSRHYVFDVPPEEEQHYRE